MINRGDIKKMLRHLGVDAEGDLVADLWAVLDQDKNNKITFEEFAPVYVNWYRYGLRQEQKLMLKPEELRQVRALVRVGVRVRVRVSGPCQLAGLPSHSLLFSSGGRFS